MADITLVNQAENSSNGVTSCSLTLDNCTVGNTLILAYVIRGSGNDPTLTDGWEKVGGGNNDSNPDLIHKLYFAKKKVENITETVTLTQTSTGRIYLVCGEFSGGDFSVVMRNDMANVGSGDYKVTASKSNIDDIILYGVTSSFYQTGTGRAQVCSPNDLTKLQGNDAEERLVCWFDDGSGSLSHEFTTSNYSGTNLISIVECVQLVVKSLYLIRDNDTIYTIQNDALVEVSGELNAQLFQSYGVEEIPSGTLLMTLSNPEVLCWTDSDKIHNLKAILKGVPFPQTIQSVDYDMTHSTILGIEKVIVDATDGVLFAVSFDEGVTWKIWTGTAWGVLSEQESGMSAEVVNGITSEQWNEVAVTGRYRFRITLSNADDKFKSLVVDYIN